MRLQGSGREHAACVCPTHPPLFPPQLQLPLPHLLSTLVQSQSGHARICCHFSLAGLGKAGLRPARLGPLHLLIASIHSRAETEVRGGGGCREYRGQAQWNRWQESGTREPRSWEAGFRIDLQVRGRVWRGKHRHRGVRGKGQAQVLGLGAGGSQQVAGTGMEGQKAGGYMVGGMWQVGRQRGE